MTNKNTWGGFARTALYAAVAVVVAAPALAQNTTGAITGRVTDGAGKPVAGATVVITYTDSKTVSTTSTDAEGRYTARGLRVGGPYTVSIGRDGKADQRDEVFVMLGETLSFDAQLGTATVVEIGRASCRERV